MEKIAENLSPVTKRLRIIYLKDLNEKDDISDWLEINGFKKNRFEKLINSEAIEWDDLKHSKKPQLSLRLMDSMRSLQF